MQSLEISNSLRLQLLFPTATGCSQSFTGFSLPELRTALQVGRIVENHFRANPPPDHEFGLRLPWGNGDSNLCLYLRLLFDQGSEPRVGVLWPNLSSHERIILAQLLRCDYFGENLPLILSFFWCSTTKERAVREQLLVEVNCPSWLTFQEHFLLISGYAVRCEAAASGFTSQLTMEAFLSALNFAAEEGGFSLPEGFIYAGGNPLSVRHYLYTNLGGPQDERAREVLLVAIAVNFFGTRLCTDGPGHPKYSKQGRLTQEMVQTTAKLIPKINAYGIPGLTLNSAGSSVPEIGLLTLMADRQRPAPSVAQIAFNENVKKGLLDRTEKVIGVSKLGTKGTKSASDAATNAIMASEIGIGETPFFGGNIAEKTFKLFEGSLKSNMAVDKRGKLAKIIEAFYGDLQRMITSSVSMRAFQEATEGL